MKAVKLCYKVKFAIILGEFGHASVSSSLAAWIFYFGNDRNIVHKISTYFLHKRFRLIACIYISFKLI